MRQRNRRDDQPGLSTPTVALPGERVDVESGDRDIARVSVAVGRSRRFVLLGCLVVACALAVVAHTNAAPPYARSVTASLTMTSAPTDGIGGGKSYSFSTPDTTFETWSGTPEVMVLVQGVDNGSWPGVNQRWELWFDAPSGQNLVPGLYENAGRRSFRPPELPGLSVSGNGHECNSLQGSFNVLAADFGRHGYIEYFHATFEQFCDGSTAALRGEIELRNPPAPPEISATVTVEPTAQLKKGGAIVRGTIACNRPPVNGLSYIQLEVSQALGPQPARIARGSIGIYDCTTTPTPWIIVAAPADEKRPLGKAPATVTLGAHLVDDFYGIAIDSAPIQTTVDLKQG